MIDTSKYFRLKLAALLASGLVLNCSCGYTVRSGIAHDIRRINVAIFENRTFEHGIEVELSAAIAREFIVDGTLSVGEIHTADVRMSGTVLEYILEPYTYGVSEADIEQYRLAVRASVILRSVHADRVLWEEKQIEGETTYYVSGALAKTESEAARDVLHDLARRIVARTVRSW